MEPGFLTHMRIVPDHLVAGMAAYPLDGILLAALTGILCGADGWDGIETVGRGLNGNAILYHLNSICK